MICSVENCTVTIRCKGLCNKHYQARKQAAKIKPCACGCGDQTSYTFKWGHHTRLFTQEEQSRRARHNDGSTQRDRGAGLGYRKVGGRHEHRRVAEQLLGRALLPGEIVHHVNSDKRDNRPENLRVTTQSQHINEHRQDLIEGRRRAKGY